MGKRGVEMRNIFAVLLIAVLSTNTAWGAVQAEGQVRPASAGQALPGDDLLPLLPQSDLIMTIDLPVVLTEILPRLEKLGVKGLQPIAAAVSTITTRLGIEPRQLGGSAIGLSFQSFEATGLLLVKGLDPDQKTVEDLLRLYKVEYKVAAHEGVTIFSVTNPPNLPAIGPLTLRISDLAVAALGQGVVAVGDLSRIRKVIEGRKASAANGSNQLLVTALRGDGSPAPLRFAFTLTSAMREEALNQGDLFRSIAAVRVVQGGLRLSPELVTDLNALMRTSSAGEATELEQGLKGLLNLARVLLSNGNQLITDLLNRARITVRSSDVSITINLPPAFIERLVPRTP
jgi:hypothetical protein